MKESTDNQSIYWKLLLEGNPKNENPSAPELLCLGIWVIHMFYDAFNTGQNCINGK